MSNVINHPLETVRTEHTVQLAICDVLESIADGLPNAVDLGSVATARGLLDQAFFPHIRFEEEQLFPRLRYRVKDSESLLRILDQLTRQHQRDECAILEVSDAFCELAEKGRFRNAEMLGYMLRGFFEGQRSHIEFESSAILPVAAAVLTIEDVEGMRGWLSRNQQDRSAQWAATSLNLLRAR